MRDTTPICSVSNCDRRHKAHGLCDTHYSRLRRTGQVADTPITTRDAVCTISDCSQPHRAKGYCEKHYVRYWRLGDPLAQVRRYGHQEIRGEAHPSWTDSPAYTTVHARLRRIRGQAKAHACECGKQARDWSYTNDDPAELINPNTGHAYSADIYRYKPMCRSCHRSYDIAVAQAKAGAR